MGKGKFSEMNDFEKTLSKRRLSFSSFFPESTSENKFIINCRRCENIQKIFVLEGLKPVLIKFMKV